MKRLISTIAVSGFFFGGFAQIVAADDCYAIADSYASALQAARVCDPGAPDSCATSRARSLRDVCRCQIAVNPGRTADLDRVAAQFKAQSCAYDRPVCTLACTIPVHMCVATADLTPSCADH